MSADKKERKKARIPENVTATILVAMEIRSCSPTGINTKGGKRPRAVGECFSIASGGEAKWSSFTWRTDEGKQEKNIPSLSGFTIGFSSPATFQKERV